MTMLTLTKEKLDAVGLLTPKLNTITQQVVNAISFPTVDPKMKAVIAVSQLVTFAAQFRRNIILWDDTPVTINGISFSIAGSGSGKDSSVNAARKCFAPGYLMITGVVEKRVVKEAIEQAQKAGEELFEEPSTYRSYMKPIPPINITPTTGPGLIQHITDIAALGLTSGALYSGEFSDELAHNPNMAENIKLLSELYDLGIKEASYTKGAEFRAKEVKGQPISALFVGSPGHILYDEITKKKFNVAFMSKLARRSWFCYTPDTIPEPVFPSIDAMLDYEEELEIKAKQAREALVETIKSVTVRNLSKEGVPLTIHPDVVRLFKVYKRYNNDLVDSIPNQESTYALIRRHLQWKALKLAGAYAILANSDVIEVSHYVEAAQFGESLDKDMEVFEKDLNKSYHERFSDFIRTQVAPDGKAIISMHDIKKLGFIDSVSKNKLQEMVTLCAGYDLHGIYSLINEGAAVQYEPTIATSVLTVSFKPIDNTALNKAVAEKNPDNIRAAKHVIAGTTAYGYETEETAFCELSALLEGDYAYTSFKFTDGVRGKSNIIGGTKWVVLDVDDSPISASEAHFMLSDLNHHIALSSDPENEFKFRVLIELDAVVELDAVAWKHFYLGIAKDLGLLVDPLPQSQIFFSYAGRPVMSVTDAEPIMTRDYVMHAKERSAAKESASKKQTPAQKQALLNDPLETFNFAFEAELGTVSRNTVRAMYYLKDLGGDVDEALGLFESLQEYWPARFEERRASAMRTQITNIFGG